MIGHLLRHEGLIWDILEAKIGLKRRRERLKLDYYSQIVKDMGCHTFREMQRLVEDRREWRMEYYKYDCEIILCSYSSYYSNSLKFLSFHMKMKLKIK